MAFDAPCAGFHGRQGIPRRPDRGDPRGTDFETAIEDGAPQRIVTKFMDQETSRPFPLGAQAPARIPGAGLAFAFAAPVRNRHLPLPVRVESPVIAFADGGFSGGARLGPTFADAAFGMTR